MNGIAMLEQCHDRTFLAMWATRNDVLQNGRACSASVHVCQFMAIAPQTTRRHEGNIAHFHFGVHRYAGGPRRAFAPPRSMLNATRPCTKQLFYCTYSCAAGPTVQRHMPTTLSRSAGKHANAASLAPLALVNLRCSCAHYSGRKPLN